MMGQEGQENPNILDNSKEVTPGAAPDPAKTGENAQQPAENEQPTVENTPKSVDEASEKKVEPADTTKDTSIDDQPKSTDSQASDVKFSSVQDDKKSETTEAKKSHPWEILPTDDTNSTDSKKSSDKKTHKNLFGKKKKLTKEEKLEKKKQSKERRKEKLAKSKTWIKKHKALTAVICVVVIAVIVGVIWLTVSKISSTVTTDNGDGDTSSVDNSDEDDDESMTDDEYYSEAIPKGVTIRTAYDSEYAFQYAFMNMRKYAKEGIYATGEINSAKLEDNIENFLKQQKDDYERLYYKAVAVSILTVYEDTDGAKQYLDELEKYASSMDNRQRYAFYLGHIRYYTEIGDKKKENEYCQKMMDEVPNEIIDEETGEKREEKITDMFMETDNLGDDYDGEE